MKKIFISFAILAGVTLSGCNDSFLDKLPVTDPTEETVFKSYDNFLAFMWPCYEHPPGWCAFYRRRGHYKPW